jgi:hypothetical protein
VDESDDALSDPPGVGPALLDVPDPPGVGPDLLDAPDPVGLMDDVSRSRFAVLNAYTASPYLGLRHT